MIDPWLVAECDHTHADVRGRDRLYMWGTVLIEQPECVVVALMRGPAISNAFRRQHKSAFTQCPAGFTVQANCLTSL
ncbi:hypothetical protein CCL23_23495 [Pseudomonas syringae]|nr:hypothetical protein CCL23_23495 [Pseudomonas syringae]